MVKSFWYTFLTHKDDFPILIIWMSTLPFLGVSGVIFFFLSLFDEIPVSIQNSPRSAILFAHVPYKGRQAYMG